ncbi:hypothetical protein ACFV23_04755 [Streptomyces sp. NPDC059627]|uniref:Uncharacterized protein n=1 Tax=Streptomyces hyaluromycini TaxID=1377993 RepID=A0ABV1WMA0_9ACTN
MHYGLIAPGALAEGIGDPYYPAYGNGGYDVSHYDPRPRSRTRIAAANDLHEH